MERYGRRVPAATRLISGPSGVWIRYRRNIKANTSHASSSKNCMPIQIRDPRLNGKYANGCRAFTASGSKRNGSGQTPTLELNPVRAGMVDQPEDYPWSSHRRNAQGESGKNADWISPHGEYLRLGHDAVERKESYRELFHTVISSNDLREIRECTHKGWALGNERFREQVEALGKRRATSKGVGRPRKDKNHVCPRFLCSSH